MFLGASSNDRLRGYLDQCEDVFFVLDNVAQGTIKFRNSCLVDIYDIRTIFSGRCGEHKELRGIYHISYSRNSIIN